jgi:hypothetical protein
MKVRLTKLQSTNTNLRTNEVVGETDCWLTVGSPFVMTATPLVCGDVRIIETSLVTEVTEYPHGWEFKTINSTYYLDILTDDKSN